MRSDETTSAPSVLRRALSVAHVVDVRLVGGSMAPLIASHANGRVVRCELEELRRFDVAVYERYDRVIAHLVIRADADGVRPATLRGDMDAPLTRGELLGRIHGLIIRRTEFVVPRAIARGVVATVHWATRETTQDIR